MKPHSLTGGESDGDAAVIADGRIRMIYEGLYERQPDGSVLYAGDHFGF